VVCRVVDRVDADGVDAELDELSNVTRAGLDVGDGVDEVGGATGLIVDAANIEALTSSEEG